MMENEMPSEYDAEYVSSVEIARATKRREKLRALGS
jgi:hypothetical protein